MKNIFENSFEKWLDTLSDIDLLIYVITRFQETRPIWKEISEEEYKEHSPEDNFTIGSEEWFVAVMKNIMDFGNYKKVPFHKDMKEGLLEQIKLFDKEPDGYRYYKRTGEEKYIAIGGEWLKYLNKRNLIKDGHLDRSPLIPPNLKEKFPIDKSV